MKLTHPEILATPSPPSTFTFILALLGFIAWLFIWAICLLGFRTA
jgi:hypothetical protein